MGCVASFKKRVVAIALIISAGVNAVTCARVCSVLDFGGKCVDPFFKTPFDNANAIRAAIAHCAGNSTTSAGYVSFDNKCEYLTSPIVVPEGTRLEMGGATLAALEPTDPEGFFKEHYASYLNPGATPPAPPALLTLSSRSELVAFGDLGIVSGGAQLPGWMAVAKLALAIGAPPPTALRVESATDVTIGPITVQNPAGAAVNISASHSITSHAIGTMWDMNNPVGEIGGLYIWGSTDITAITGFDRLPVGQGSVPLPSVVISPDSLGRDVANIALANFVGRPSVHIDVPAWGGNVFNVTNAEFPPPMARGPARPLSANRGAASMTAQAVDEVRSVAGISYDEAPIVMITTAPGATGKVMSVWIHDFNGVMMGPAIIVDQWGGADSAPPASSAAVQIAGVALGSLTIGRSSSLCGFVRCVPGACSNININSVVRAQDGRVPNHWECYNVVLDGQGNQPSLPSQCNATSASTF